VKDVLSAFETRFGDGTHITELRQGPGKQPCGYSKFQVAATCLDPRNMPALGGIPADEHDKAWEIVTELVVAKMKADYCPAPVVGEGSSSTMDMEDEWMKDVAESTYKKSVAERAKDEIDKWKIRTKPSDKDNDPLKVWKQASKHCPYLSKVARDVLAVPATSAAPERKFSKAGDVNTKKRASITCENLEELVFLNEALPVVKKMRAEKEIKGASK
jgi:hypothetical protein